MRWNKTESHHLWTNTEWYVVIVFASILCHVLHRHSCYHYCVVAVYLYDGDYALHIGQLLGLYKFRIFGFWMFYFGNKDSSIFVFLCLCKFRLISVVNVSSQSCYYMVTLCCNVSKVSLCLIRRHPSVSIFSHFPHQYRLTLLLLIEVSIIWILRCVEGGNFLTLPYTGLAMLLFLLKY